MRSVTNLSTPFLLALLVSACSGDGKATPDASQNPVPDGGGMTNPDATVADAAPPPPDAAPVVCSAITFTGAPASAGATDDLYGTGPGAWVSNGATGMPPGDLLYVEGYRGLLNSDTVTQTQFQTWLDCGACIFLARQCTSFTIETTDMGNPVQPTCEKLFMLDTGVVTFTSFDVSPAAAGRLAGTVTPLSGQSSVRLIQVNSSGDPGQTSGFGSAIPGGECLEIPSLAFDGMWVAPPVPADAGVPDAG
jgi:hypothetical protein